MNVLDFARALLRTGDLDPIYMMLNRAELEPSVLRRWCLAYWMFYHAGVASRCAEAKGTAFWETVQRAQDEKWPRGTERRHFRGAASQMAIDELCQSYAKPEDAVGFIIGDRMAAVRPFEEVRGRALQWRGFGPWIAFKMADMVDGVLGFPVDFTDSVPYWFDDPVLGAFIVSQEQTGFGSDVALERGLQAPLWEQRNHLGAAVNYLASHLRDACPHAPERFVSLQEYETVLCKYKSHVRGNYEVGKDTHEILHGLEGDWGKLGRELHYALYSVRQERGL